MIAPAKWAEVEDEDSGLEDAICIAFDVSPDRRSTIVVVLRGRLICRVAGVGRCVP